MNLTLFFYYPSLYSTLYTTFKALSIFTICFIYVVSSSSNSPLHGYYFSFLAFLSTFCLKDKIILYFFLFFQFLHTYAHIYMYHLSYHSLKYKCILIFIRWVKICLLHYMTKNTKLEREMVMVLG